MLAGLLVFLMAFGLFGATTSRLTGYELETAKVTEGLVRTGELRHLEGSPLQDLEYAAEHERTTPDAGIPGRGGHRYGRTGLLQPILEAPFYSAGWALDELRSDGRALNNRQLALMLYNPFVAALAAVAIFALVLGTRGSLRWAAAITMLFVIASIAWPYAKIGMETTFMFVVISAFALGVYARQRKTPLVWALAGFAAGAATATKAYGAVAPVAIALLLWPTFRDLDPPQQIRLGLAFALPITGWLAADAWYNWWRFDSVLGTGTTRQAPTKIPLALAITAIAALGTYTYRRRSSLFWAVVAVAVVAATATMAHTAIGVAGLLASPGKGLIFYSPLVILGALGLPRLWRQDPWLTASLLLLFGALIVLAGDRPFWGDETWGPRYLVPVAWVLLVPIAWWTTTKVRLRILICVAALGVVVQIVAVSVHYTRYIEVVSRLTGVTPYGPRVDGTDPQRIPYGDDPPRWIPELSPLLVQAQGLLSFLVIEPLGGDGLKVSYAPFEGRERTVDLSAPTINPEIDFWWYVPYDRLVPRLGALSLLLLSVAGGVGLYRVSSRAPRAPPSVSPGERAT